METVFKSKVFGSCSRKHTLHTWTPGVPADEMAPITSPRGPCARPPDDERLTTKFLLLHLPHISNARAHPYRHRILGIKVSTHRTHMVKNT